jgi:hypothetical protein
MITTMEVFLIHLNQKVFFSLFNFFYITFIYYICIRLLLSLLFLAEEGISAKLSIGSFTIAEETMLANKSK